MTHAVYHAPYACHPDASRGRQHNEPESKTRTPYQRDRDRILHCGAFRRLKHKTQVFVAHVHVTSCFFSIKTNKLIFTIFKIFKNG